MARTKFMLVGADELIKQMEILADKDITSATRKGLKSTIPDLFYNITSRIPVKTGKLRSEIDTYGPKIIKKKMVVHGGVMTPTREKLGIKPEDPNYWPSALEYGSKAHWITKKGRGVLGGGLFRKTVKHPGTAPVAFMRNGADASKDQFDANMRREIEKTIKRVQKKINKLGAGS